MTASAAQNDTRVLVAPESLGLETREAFREETNALLDEMSEGRGRLVIDLSGTRDIDSSGLSVLVMIHRHASDRRQRIALAHLSPELEFLLVLTKLDDLFVVGGKEA